MKKTSKILAAVMALVMVIAAIPMSAFAADYTISLGETITVTAPKEGYSECKFTPEADGKYVVYSDMGEADIDPYVYVYDADGNEIADDDDNNYARTCDFYCIFEAEAGSDYLFKMYSWDSYAVEFDITVTVFGEITHQPTADEPYVEVTEGADAEYQWYKLGDSIVELTDEYAEPREDEYVGNFATYDSENGWTGVYNGYYNESNKEYNFFKVMLLEDQTIKMTADTDAVRFGIWCICHDCDEFWENVNANDTVEFTADHSCVYYTWGQYAQVPHLKAEMPEMTKVNTDAELKAKEAGTYVCLVTFDGCRCAISDAIYRAAPPEAIKLNETKSVTAPKDAYLELTFTPEADGKYVVYSDNGGNDEIDPYVYVYDAFGNQIADDDDNDYTWSYNFCCEFEAEAGEVYYLQFCAYDDTVTYDVTVVNRAEISHQPTEAEPYVEIAPEANASYQWFKVREGEAEITDKNVVNIVELDTVSTYSASKGWIPANEPAYYDADKDYYWFFWIYLEEGDKLTLDINGTIEEYIAIESYEDYIEFELTTSETNGSYTFEVEHTGVYTVYCYGEPGLTAKATVNGTYLEKVDGATDAALTPDEKCEYICNVTYDAGRYEFSDKVEITAIKHDITVTNGTASKTEAVAGETITLTANTAPEGKEFDKWVVTGATVADATKATITFVMPENDVTAEATYKEIPSTTEPTTEPTTKPAEVPTTTKPVENKPTEPTTKPEPVNYPELSIEKPSKTKINYKDGIVLHATVENLPAGAKIEWSADNSNFAISDDNNGNLTAISNAKGDTVFTAKIKLADGSYAKDANGNEIKDEVTINSNAGFFQKVIGFFKSLFGMTTVYDEK